MECNYHRARTTSNRESLRLLTFVLFSMATLITEAARQAALKLGYPSLREHQLEAITSFVQGSDVFVVLPTGYGKSLCFACLPLVFDQLEGSSAARVPSIVVVATSLTALIKDQVGVVVFDTVVFDPRRATLQS